MEANWLNLALIKNWIAHFCDVASLLCEKIFLNGMVKKKLNNLDLAKTKINYPATSLIYEYN